MSSRKRRWLRELTAGTVLGVLLATVVWAATQTKNPIPSANSTFLPDLQTFLRNEDAQRYIDHFQGFVVQNGLHGTVAGLTGNPGDTIAYPGGFYARETATITYPDASTCWVIMHSDTTGNLATFLRVAGTKYLRDCTSGVQPAQPTGAVYLMQVTTAAGAVTAVTDLRPRTPVSVVSGGTGIGLPFVVGDLIYAPTTSTWGRLADIADGNVLRSGGVGVAPVYGKVRISGATTDITGTLPINSGGTATTTVPANGQLLIGNGVGYSVATLTAGSGIAVTNGAGSVTVSSVAPQSTGTWASRGLSAFNNASVPNTRFDMSATTLVLRNAANEIVTRHGTGTTLTNDVALAGPTANGRDQAAVFSSNSWVHFYWICCNVADASLSSAAPPAVGPTLPSGYTYWAYVGAVRFNGSSQLVQTYIRGSIATYIAKQAALTSGVSTTEATVSLTALVPPNASMTMLELRLVTVGSSGTSDFASLRLIAGTEFTRVPNTDSALNITPMTLTVPNLSQQVFYLVTAAVPELSIGVLGYTLPNGGS